MLATLTCSMSRSTTRVSSSPVSTLAIEIADAYIWQRAHFVDISASYSGHRSLEALNDQARASGVTGVLSVGLVPGITNLLVRHVHDVLGAVGSAEIAVLLGLGDTHGRGQSSGCWRTAAPPWASRSLFSFLSHMARERHMPSISPTSTSFGINWCRACANTAVS